METKEVNILFVENLKCLSLTMFNDYDLKNRTVIIKTVNILKSEEKKSKNI